jgi:hypothetical protein
VTTDERWSTAPDHHGARSGSAGGSTYRSGSIYSGGSANGGGRGRDDGPYDLRDPYRQPGYAPRSRRSGPSRPAGVYPGGRPRRRGRNRLAQVMIGLMVVGLVAIGAGLKFLPGASLFSGPRLSATGDAPTPVVTTPPPPPPPLPFHEAPVNVDTKGFLAWALLDRNTGEIVGSANLTEAKSTTASMIKAWLASDYLRRASEKGETPTKSRLADLEIMIRDSDNNAATRTYNLNGKTASIQRLISMCGLTESKATSGEWSRTYVSARDTVRMGLCIGDGRAAGPTWTPWVLDMMRKVRGLGDFGIRKALPADQAAEVAIKNGWLLRDEDHLWHTSCMAIGKDWVMAVLQRYPPTAGWNTDFEHTRQVCQEVATQLRNPAAG